ncbi:DUF4062 domain-containing protein [Sinomicrobium sp. M5D2P9]
MEVKYQVFVSSTYKDLVEERQEVMQALLELDCIPVGMELFPAADDDQWTLIKGLIDDCDYYILIVGGRYGSVNPEGISYTQMEYEYAMEKGIPVISFLHKNPENIAVGKSESEKALKKKLEDFKKIVQQKMCKYYESPIELGSIVSRSLVRLIKDKPQPGWVKATYLPTEDSTKEILELTKQVENLKLELEKSKTKAPEGTEFLSQGDDKIEVNFTFKAQGDWRTGNESYSVSTQISWDEIFGEISPLMIDETSERPIRVKLNELIRNKTFKELSEKVKKDERVPTEFSIKDTDYQTIKIQLRALNLMTESIRKRGVRDTATYWTLTPYGDTVMTRLRAIKRKPE